MKTVHIGLMKTGTTFLQHIFKLNRPSFADQGLLYPGSLLNQQHACYGLAGEHIPWVKDPSKRWRQLGADMLQEIKQHQGDVLISSEALASMPDEGVKDFCGQLGGIDHAVITIRNYHSVLLSAWQQQLKGGGIKTIEEFFAGLTKDRESGNGLWKTYSLRKAANTWAKHANVELIVVDSRYPEEKGTSAIQAFSDILRTSIQNEAHHDPKSRNVSLTFEDAEMLRRVNSIIDGSTEVKQRVIRDFLEILLFPAAGRGDGSKILFPPQYIAHADEWISEEMSNLPKNLRVWGEVARVRNLNSQIVGENAAITDHQLFNRLIRLLALRTSEKNSLWRS